MTVLKIDLDWLPPEQWEKEWQETRKLILSYFNLEARRIIVHRSGSGKGLHYYIHLNKDVPDRKLLQLQFLLGDDLTRTKINYQRLKRKSRLIEWNILYDHITWKKDYCWICKLKRRWNYGTKMYLFPRWKALWKTG